MTTRAQLANRALADNGYLNGCGYPGPGNKFDQYLGRPNEYWCGDTVTAWFKESGLALPSMQSGCSTGFAYCPSALEYGHAHGIVIPSWQAQPGDIALFDWNGDGKADHTELVYAHDTGHGVLYTVGGDSGPSNIDGYKGQGGVHRHQWLVPSGSGNHQIIGVLNADHLVHFTTAAPVPPPTHTPSTDPAIPGWYHRPLSVQSPLLYGSDVVTVQGKVGATKDGYYGTNTAADVKRFQSAHGLTPDGVVGEETAEALGN